MENDVMIAVLTEVLGELKEVKESGYETKKALEALIDKLGKESATQNTTESLVDMEGIKMVVQDSIAAGLAKVDNLIRQQPKNIVHQKKFLLFPEKDSMDYYRVVFGRLLFWMFVFTVATYLFVLGRGLVEGYANNQQKDLVIENYRLTWERLYQISKKSQRLKMDSIMGCK